MSQKQFSKLKLVFVTFFILLTGLYFQWPYFNEFPLFTHAWAQSDRYAIALGFIQNNFDLFHPQTFVFNPQFPFDWHHRYDDTITAVDFPIHDFIVAILMKLFGTNTPIVFRVYTFIWSLIGLLFLFRLSNEVLKNHIKSLIVIVLAMTSPVFIFYQSGFLPSIPSWSCAIIGLYWYSLFVQKSKFKYLIYTVFFITIATLTRSTFAIILISIIGVEFIKILKFKARDILKKVMLFGGSLSIILIYSYYNGLLRNNHGSMFLHYLLPVESWEHFKEFLLLTIESWGLQYFTLNHYYLMILIVLVGGLFIFLKIRNKQRIQIEYSLLVFASISGYCIFFLLMIWQFPHHDYYFIDTFFIPFLLLILLCFKNIPDFKFDKIIYGLLLIFLSVIVIPQGKENQKERRVENDWDVMLSTYNNFKDSDLFLDSLSISHEAKILSVKPYAPNYTFILMKRSGYVFMNMSKENFEEKLAWNPDYIVFQNTFLETEIQKNYPEILNQLTFIATNNKISVFKQ